jgi:hypothetical protein
MTDTEPILFLLGIFLNTVDVIGSFFLIVGGFNATVHSAIFGYLSVGMGVVLLYLTIGVWTKTKWKLVTRLSMYALGTSALLISFAYIVIVGRRSLGELFPVPWILLILLTTVVASLIHLRLRAQGSKRREGHPQGGARS